jgi:hypothetical protein
VSYPRSGNGVQRTVSTGFVPFAARACLATLAAGEVRSFAGAHRPGATEHEWRSVRPGRALVFDEIPDLSAKATTRCSTSSTVKLWVLKVHAGIGRRRRRP